MSACGATSPDDSEQVVLRWFDTPGASMREQTVDVIDVRSRTALISAPFRLIEETAVHLVGKDYIDTGIVRSCAEQGSYYLLTIQIQSDELRPRRVADIDPGVLVIDDFVSEEAELRILKEIDDELASGGGGHSFEP